MTDYFEPLKKGAMNFSKFMPAMGTMFGAFAMVKMTDKMFRRIK